MEVLQLPELTQSAQWLLGTVLCVYMVALFGVSLYATRNVETEEDYLVAGRNLPLFFAWGSLISTWFGASSINGASDNARALGMHGTVLDPWACSGTLLLAGLFFAPAMWRLKLLTVGDFFRRTYGQQAELTACCIQVPAFFSWIATQYLVLGHIQHSYFHIPLGWGIVIGMLVTLAYTMVGGMWSVTLTDTVQILLAFVGLIMIGYTVMWVLGDHSFTAGVSNFFTKSDAAVLSPLPPLSWPIGLAWTATLITGLLGNIPGQDLMQRVFSAKSPGVARGACLLAAGSYLFFGLIPVTIGVASRLLHPDHEGAGILVYMAGTHLKNEWLLVLFVLSLVSLICSTACSAVLAPATILGHNLLGRLRLFEGRGLMLERLCVVLVSLGSLQMAFSGKGIMDLLELTLALQLVGMFVPLAMALYGNPRSSHCATLSMFLGVAAFLPRYLLQSIFLPPSDAFPSSFEYYNFIVATYPERTLLQWFVLIPAAFYGLAGSFAGYFLGQWLYRGQPPINREIRHLAWNDAPAEVAAAVPVNAAAAAVPAAPTATVTAPAGGGAAGSGVTGSPVAPAITASAVTSSPQDPAAPSA